jgi:hypothetical protein
LSEPVYEALRKVAFEEQVKIHDLVIEGIDAALRRRLPFDRDFEGCQEGTTGRPTAVVPMDSRRNQALFGGTGEILQSFLARA